MTQIEIAEYLIKIIAQVIEEMKRERIGQEEG